MLSPFFMHHCSGDLLYTVKAYVTDTQIILGGSIVCF